MPHQPVSNTLPARPSEEPGAAIPHAGICEGGAGQPASLPQSPNSEAPPRFQCSPSSNPMLLYYASSTKRSTRHFVVVPRGRRLLRRGSELVTSSIVDGMSLRSPAACSRGYAGLRQATCRRSRQPFDTWSCGRSTSVPNTQGTFSPGCSSGRHYQPDSSSGLMPRESVFVLGEMLGVQDSAPSMAVEQTTDQPKGEQNGCRQRLEGYLSCQRRLALVSPVTSKCTTRGHFKVHHCGGCGGIGY